MPRTQRSATSAFTRVFDTLCGAREDNRVSNGDQASRVAALAMKHGKSVDFTGYWQRHIEAAD